MLNEFFYIQSIKIDEKKLLNMKDKLLQKKVAMTELNSSNNEMLKKFLNNIIVMIEFTK